MTISNDPNQKSLIDDNSFEVISSNSHREILPATADQWKNQFQVEAPQILLNGSASYYPNFLPQQIADQCLNQWQTRLPWQQNTIKIYGREVVIPRKEAWLGKTGLRYQYSGKQLAAKTWPESLASLAEAVGYLLDSYFNSVLANLYRNGNDSMGWHSDDEIELGVRPTIASITLGQPRDFAFRIKGQNHMHSKIQLAHGSLLVMHAGMQEQWQHALPKRKQALQPRLNLTFRHIIEAAS